MAEREGKIWRTPSISLPVQKCLNVPWKEFGALLRDCWRHSTDLMNWGSQTIRRHDITHVPNFGQLPKMTKVDLYALAFGRSKEGRGRQFFGCPHCPRKFFLNQLENGRVPLHTIQKDVPCPGMGATSIRLERPLLPAVVPSLVDAEFWAGGKSAAASLLRKVALKYAKERGKILRRYERRTPEFLYPYPFPVHKECWVPSLGERGQPMVSMSLPGGNVSIRLRRDPERPAIYRIFQRLCEGDLSYGELAICRQSTGVSTESFPAQVEQSQNGYRNRYRVMLRISYQEEIHVCAGSNPALVKTGRDPFLTLIMPGVRESFWHGTQVKGWLAEQKLREAQVQEWVAAHRKFLDDFQDDLKFEKRWPARVRRSMNRRRERGCDLYDRRMRTFHQQTAHQAVSMAIRNRHDAIHYDDTDRSFSPSFAWFNFRTEFEDQCVKQGLRFQHVASGDMPEEDEEVILNTNNDA
jgi:hypothetical protein